MSTRAAASRYARALFDVAGREGSAEQVDQDLGAVVGLLKTHPELHRVLTNPAVPAAAKRAVLSQLGQRMGLSLPLVKLLDMLADRDRVSLLPDLAEVFGEKLMDHQQIVRAEVTTAAPLSEERAAELQQRLSNVTGHRVTMTTRVDPSIIGGVVTRIGSTVYDGSVARQLAAIRQKLVGEA